MHKKHARPTPRSAIIHAFQTACLRFRRPHLRFAPRTPPTLCCGVPAFNVWTVPRPHGRALNVGAPLRPTRFGGAKSCKRQSGCGGRGHKRYSNPTQVRRLCAAGCAADMPIDSACSGYNGCVSLCRGPWRAHIAPLPFHRFGGLGCHEPLISVIRARIGHAAL